jgi:NAD(P)-dependent dehydrogenase (short-subunit alcohol dehydrogenase family)
VVHTAFSAVVFEDESATVARYPLGRLGEPVDVAEVVLFLAGPRSAWIRGQTLTPDGGRQLGGGV